MYDCAEELFERFERLNPEPRSDLVCVNDYTFLVAVVLSAQATDKLVNKLTDSLFEIYRTPEDVVALGVEGLMHYIKGLNYYKTKAKHVVALSHILIERFHSKVPNNFADLVSLPGVGRKSANVVLNALFDAEVIAVDRHVFRVANRIGLSAAQTLEAVESDLYDVVPKKYLLNAHCWLVLHGRYTCLARKPKCASCAVADLCVYRKQELAEL